MKRSRFHPLLLLPLLTALLACAATPEESGPTVPDWVLATPHDMRYAYGVGSAPLRGDRAEARRVATERARSDLIQSLRVEVSGETRSWIERVRQEDDGPVTRGFFQEVRTRIPPTTLDEMSVADIAIDPNQDTLYALVRLDRPMATLRLSGELNQLRNRLDDYRREAAGEGRLDTIRRLRPALELIARGGEIEDQLRLVSTQPLGRPPLADSHADILRRLSAALDSLHIELDGSGMSERVLGGLRRGLLEQGLRVGGTGEPDLAIGGSLDLRLVQRGPDHFAFAEGRVEVRNAEGRLLGQFEHRVREGSTDPGLAQDRVLARLGQSLGQALGEQLIHFL